MNNFDLLTAKKAPRSFNVRNERAVKWLKVNAKTLVDSLSKTTNTRVANVLIKAFESGNVGSAYEGILGILSDEVRADTIAKTVAMQAANAGQREAWNQAVDSGLLSENAQRVWITTEVGACPLCDSMDGQTTPMNGPGYDGEFEEEYLEGPPAHPRCRCTEGIIS